MITKVAGILGGVAIAASAALMTATAAHATEGFTPCPSGQTGVATATTSCAFAEEVRYAYYTQPGMAVTAYSPVTGLYYTMWCTGGNTVTLAGYIASYSGVRCSGGDNAVVWLW